MNTKFYFANDSTAFTIFLENKEIILLADARTNGFCVPIAKQLLPNLQLAKTIVVPAGEENKTLETVSYIWQQLLENNASKQTILINIGGGTLCDMGAFAAATYKRGIAFINIPTTLLAMNDASFGGKNGINFEGIKNSIGTIQAPIATYFNAIFLQTLPTRELKSGYAEIIKHALIGNGTLWQALIVLPNEQFFISTQVLEQSIAIKNSLVSQDPTDQHQRQALNLGHSIAHALEAHALHSQQLLLHGEAVMMGLQIELYLAEKLLQTPSSIREQVMLLYQTYCNPICLSFKHTQLLPYLLQDKKNNTTTINMSLLQDIGKVAIGKEVPINLLQEAEKYFATCN